VKDSTSTGTPEESPIPHRFAPSLLVVARPGGLGVVTERGPSPHSLGLAELSLLSAIDAAPGGSSPQHIKSCIAQVMEAHGVPRPELQAVLHGLRYARALGPRPEAPSLLGERAGVEPADPALPPLDLGGPLFLHAPVVMRLRGGRYEFIGHRGTVRASLTPLEAFALRDLGGPTDRATAFAAHRLGAGTHALSGEAYDALLRHLHGAGLLSHEERRPLEMSAIGGPSREALFREHFLPSARAQDDAEREREERTGQRRIRVIPVTVNDIPPLALGTIMAYAEAFEGGRLQERLDFRHDWVWADDRFEVFTARPAVYLFSNYLWSHAHCIATSARVKEQSPHSVTIHGGPDTPGYPEDVERYFADHPHVDVTVHGEGEVTPNACKRSSPVAMRGR